MQAAPHPTDNGLAGGVLKAFNLVEQAVIEAVDQGLDHALDLRKVDEPPGFGVNFPADVNREVVRMAVQAPALVILRGLREGVGGLKRELAEYLHCQIIAGPRAAGPDLWQPRVHLAGNDQLMRAMAVMASGMVLGFGSPVLGQSPDSVFDVGRSRAVRAVVTTGSEFPGEDRLRSPMLMALSGVRADLRGRDLARLRACLPPNPFLGDPRHGDRVAVVHLAGADGDWKRVELVRTGSGFVAVELDPGERAPARAELKREAVLELMSGWTVYRGGFGEAACADPRAEVFEVPRPYASSLYTMDVETMSERFLAGRRTNLPSSSRDLAQEVFHARIPRGYDPRRPAGLLVWVDARMGGGGGEPPQVFHEALDELGIICIGAANSGNDRYAQDRYQLALDAVETASQRWHVDARRIYLSGISGGGRISSMLIGAFPDVFAGAVPIVGMSFYKNVPTGNGKMVRAGYLAPRGELMRVLRTRPIAPMTGPKDFNYQEMVSATHLMRRDGLLVRLFEYTDMAHEMPTSERFAEALRWVDTAYQAVRAEEQAAAARSWELYRSRWGEESVIEEAGRRVLERVTAEGPWTEEAWRAAGLLGADAP